MRAGTLVVDIAANVARLQQDMAQAKGVVESSMRDITSAVNVAKSALGLLGVSASVGVFAGMIKDTLEAEAGLLRLAQRAASTVEAMSSLSAVAKRSGTDLDDVAKGMQKLAKSMAEAGDGTSKAGKVFDALKISTTDATGALRPAQEVMQELGTKLMGMKDQTLAVAFAQETMGKAGANLLPFLYELAQAGTLNAKVTTEQAKAAKQFEDNLKTLEAAGQVFKRALANDMVPALIDFTNKLIDAQKAGGNLLTALMLVATGGKSLADIDAEITSKQAALDGRSGLTKTLGAGMIMSPLGPAMTLAGVGPLADAANQAQLSLLYRQREYAQLSMRRAASGIVDPLNSTPGKVDVPNPLGGAANQTDYYTPLARSAQERIALLKQEASSTTPLTEAHKTLIKLQADLTAGYVSLNPKQLAAVNAWLLEEDALQKANRAKTDWAKLQLEIFNSREKFLDQQDKSIESMTAENRRIKEQNEEIGLTKVQIDALKVSRMDEMIVKAERDRMAQSAGGAEEIELANLQRKIDLLKERRGLLQQGVFAQSAADQAKAAEEAFKKTASSIDNALTTSIANGLMGGFKKGDGIVKSFVTMMEDAFKTAVLTPIIKAVVAPIAGGIAGMLPNYAGAAGFAGAAAGGGGFSLGSIFSGASTAYNASTGQGIFGLFGGGGGNLAAAGGMAIEDGWMLAGLEAAGPGLGMLGPIGLGIGAIGLLGGLFGGSGHGPKPGEVNLVYEGGGFGFGNNNLPGDQASNLAYLISQNASLNDPTQYDPAVLHQFVGRSVSGVDAQSGVAQLRQVIDAAHQAALAKTASTSTMTVAQQAALQGTLGSQSSLVNVLGSFAAGQSTSSYLAPMDQLSGAQSIFSNTLAAARAGDPNAIQGIGGAASNLLSIGRTVYASGPQFADLMKTVNSQLGDLLQRSTDANTAALNAMPDAIKNAAQSQIDAINAQTSALSQKLDALSQDVRQLAQAVA